MRELRIEIRRLEVQKKKNLLMLHFKTPHACIPICLIKSHVPVHIHVESGLYNILEFILV